MSVKLKVRHMAVEIACLNEKYMSAEVKNMSAKRKKICVGQDKEQTGQVKKEKEKIRTWL
jgi:hypothetical protein